MDTGNALYQFTEPLTNVSDSPLEYANLHLDVYEPFTGDAGKWIRFSGMRGGEVELIGNKQVRVWNAVHRVYFVVRPEDSNVDNRMAARELSQSMADRWAAEVLEDERLGGRVCGVGNIIQVNDWLEAGGSKMPTTILQITINPRKR